MKKKVEQPVVEVTTQNPIDSAATPTKECDIRLPVAGTVIINAYHGKTFAVKVFKNGFKCKEAVNEIISFSAIKEFNRKGANYPRMGKGKWNE